MPHDPSGDASDRRSAEDAAWQAIVDNYGERPHLDEEPAEVDPGADPASATDLAEEVPGSPRDLVEPRGPEPAGVEPLRRTRRSTSSHRHHLRSLAPSPRDYWPGSACSACRPSCSWRWSPGCR